MYVQDNDEKWPYLNWNDGGAARTKGINFIDASVPYIKSRQVWFCPDGDNTVHDADPWGPNADNAHVDYAWNEQPGADGLTLSANSYPASTFMYADKGSSMCLTPWCCEDRYVFMGWTGQPGPHSDGKVMGFADGHSKWLHNTAIRAKDFYTNMWTYNANSPYYAWYKN